MGRNLGVWICYDTRFPEISRALSAKGADILCVPAAFYSPNADQWETLLKAAAIYNVLPVAAVNQYGSLTGGGSFLEEVCCWIRKELLQRVFLIKKDILLEKWIWNIPENAGRQIRN